MTTEEKLKAVTEDIRSKLPRLKELEQGCICITDDRDCEVFYIDDNCAYLYFTKLKLFQEYNKKYFIDNTKIIGKEPMLNNVLEWLAMTVDEFHLTADYHVFKKKAFLSISMDNIGWDLSKLYLKDQSEEFINFLYKLLIQQ